jgi:hypothetical protein
LSFLTLVIPFDVVELILCYFYVGRCDDPICVHFVFKCKIINNALILGELSCICYNTLLCLFQLVLIIVGRQIFSFWYLVCHHKKCGEFGLLLEPCSLWELLISFLVICFSLLKWDMSLSMCVLVILYAHWLLLCSLVELWSQSCVKLILWYNLDNLLLLHNFVYSLVLLGVLSKLYLLWLLKVLCMHIY